MTASRPLSRLLLAIFVLALATVADGIGAGPRTNKADGAEPPSSSELTGGWHFVRTRHPQGGPDAISIMHTADTSRSDLDLAGLMIRCRERGTEVIIVLIRTFPFRARPHVVFGKPGNESKFEASVAPPGTSVLLPVDATILVSGPWQAQSDLFIKIEDGQTTISGVVALAGLQAAFKVLATSCPAQ